MKANDDENERAHMEYDWDNQSLTIIYNVLNRTKDENHHETIPVKNKEIFSIYNENNAYIIDLMDRYLIKNPQISVYKFLFVSLSIISETYFPYIEEMDKSKDQINRQLRKRTTKKYLLALSDIETGMVYLVYAANQNVVLLEQLKAQASCKRLDGIEKEQLEDSIIEARQLYSMTQINAQVLQQLSSTYNNILNNNLNDNMTTLTIISIVLAVIAVITGFFGMNVPLPLADEEHAWIYIIISSVVLWLIIVAILRYIVSKKSSQTSATRGFCFLYPVPDFYGWFILTFRNRMSVHFRVTPIPNN
ncbi:magnesium transporter CorA family protein [Streptococcus sp. X16XC17]|uniref:magnesium transporter CorA family protein n=1 Tax=Streptococcus sp. X16XC17 TaxID=2316646 RepID=UPI0022A9182D|nr:magnesium transporter CorA family protein [Streptococcus sp. X16XC17]